MHFGQNLLVIKSFIFMNKENVHAHVTVLCDESLVVFTQENYACNIYIRQYNFPALYIFIFFVPDYKTLAFWFKKKTL